MIRIDGMFRLKPPWPPCHHPGNGDATWDDFHELSYLQLATATSDLVGGLEDEWIIFPETVGNGSHHPN